MERLTNHYGNMVGIIGCSTVYPNEERKRANLQTAIVRLAAYEDTGLEPEAVEAMKIAMMGKSIAEIKEFNGVSIDHLCELVQAEQNGRLVVLPCKVGETVYQLCYMTHREALQSGVPQSSDKWQNRKYGRKKAAYLPLFIKERKMVKSLYQQFGKTVFLTREEAEAALQKEKS